MRHFCIVLAVALVANICCRAQDFPRHELSLGYGTLLVTDYLDAFVSIFDALAGDQKSNESYLGSINLGYTYNFNKYVGVGAKMSYAMNAYDVWRDDIKLGRECKNYYTFMPIVRANWLNREALRLYSYAGVGAIFNHYTMAGAENQTDWLFAFQLTPLGIELGRDMAFFAELGVGQLGTFGAGVRYRF